MAIGSECGPLLFRFSARVSAVCRRWRRLYVLASFITLCFVVTFNPTKTMMETSSPPLSFVDVLTSRADVDRYVILALVDEAFTDMAVNLYESSLAPNNISNFLFVGVGRRTCEILAEFSLPCYHYVDDDQSVVASSFETDAFNRKMNYRTDMILEALDANFTVLHTDLDVYFASNPLPDLKPTMKKADVAALWDKSEFNAGFIVIRPTAASRQLYDNIRNLTVHNLALADQKALGAALKSLARARVPINAVRLDRRRYACGFDYFEAGKRLFPVSSPGGVIVVHNNWIVGKEAKVYRFREHLMWMLDPNGSYYGSKSHKYLVYDNPLLEPASVKARGGKRLDHAAISVAERDALKVALIAGHLLGRVVVLPRFHWGPAYVECPLNAVLDVKAFDDQFAGLYRENSFFRHPKVPQSFKDELTVSRKRRSASVEVSVENIMNATRRSLTPDQLLKDLGDVSEEAAVLEVDWRLLFGRKIQLGDEEFQRKLDHGFVENDYRQLRQLYEARRSKRRAPAGRPVAAAAPVRVTSRTTETVALNNTSSHH